MNAHVSEQQKQNAHRQDVQKRLWNLPEKAPSIYRAVKPPRLILPEAGELESMLRHHSIGELSKILGFSRRAITTRLRRAGLGVGLLPKREPVLKARPPQEVVCEPRKLPLNRVIRITSIGVQVTMPRVAFIDGEGC